MKKNSNYCGLHLTKIENITVEKDNQKIIHDISFEINCNEITMIVGRNGAGKSTLLKAILGEIPHKGKVEFYDKKENKYKKISIGYVPQSLNIERDMPTTVYDMFASYVSNKPVWLKKNKTLEEKILEQLKIFGAESTINKRVGNLSGGELQRVLLAIATTPIPNLLILDEPVSGIDVKGTLEVYEILTMLKQKYDMSVLLVSHDIELVNKYADKVILLDKTIVKQGKPEEVLSSKEFLDRFGKAVREIK